MIKQIRIDEKLLNKNFTYENARSLGATTVLLVDDRMAGDELMKKGTMMQAVPDLRLQIRGTEESIRLLKDPRAEKMSVFIVCKSPKIALKLVENLNIPEVNVANYPCRRASEKTQLNDHWAVTEEDLPVFEALNEKTNGNLFNQMIPTFEKSYFKDLIAKAK